MGRYCGLPRSAQGQDEDLVVSLTSSQARTAEVLERRINKLPQLPGAYQILWVLARVHRRILCSTLSKWRMEQPASAGRPTSPSPRGPSPRGAPSPGAAVRRWGDP